MKFNLNDLIEFNVDYNTDFFINYIFITLAVIFVCSCLTLIISLILKSKIMMRKYILQYKDSFELNKLYIYDYGDMFNKNRFTKYYIKRNDEEPILIMKESITTLSFQVGDRFTIPKLNNVEINITEELKDSVLFFTFTKHSVNQSYLPNNFGREFAYLRYKKNISKIILEYARKENK